MFKLYASYGIKWYEILLMCFGQIEINGLGLEFWTQTCLFMKYNALHVLRSSLHVMWISFMLHMEPNAIRTLLICFVQIEINGLRLEFWTQTCLFMKYNALYVFRSSLHVMWVSSMLNMEWKEDETYWCGSAKMD